MKHLLERLGLGRPELRAWAMYDWANSAFQTTIVAAVFPIYFHNVVAADLGDSVATSRFAWATTLAIVIVALVAPLLGAIADYAAMKKRMLGIFVGVGVLATTAMYWIRAGDWVFALTLFIIGNIAVAGSIVFYESLLPHLVSDKELDRVSSAGYAIGYLGGGVLLAVNLLMIQRPSLVRNRRRRHGGQALARRASASGGWCSRFRSSARCPSRCAGSTPASRWRAAFSASAYAV